MTDIPATGLAEIEAFYRRPWSSPTSRRSFETAAELADRVAVAGRTLPRMPSKEDEPAHSFRVPQP